jgi:ArsR family transcriptional regulator
MPVNSLSDSTVITAGFHALADSLRLAVLELLKQQELCVCDLCDRLQVSQSKLSFHLKTLKEAGLVVSRQEGRWIYYSLNLSQFVLLEQYLADFRRNAVIVPRNCCD